MHFSQVHKEHSLKDHILSDKTNLNKVKKTEIIQHIFVNHNIIKIEINRRKTSKFTNMWKLNNTLLSTTWKISYYKGN